MRRAVVGFSLLVGAMLAVPATSSAGTYVDWECAGPTGAAVAARGFEPEETAQSSAVNTCGTAGGSLSVGLTGNAPWQGGQNAAYRYAAPDDTRIAGVTIDRSTSGLTAVPTTETYRIAIDNSAIDSCAGANCGNVSGQVTQQNLSAAGLLLTAGCGGLSLDQCSNPFRLNVTRAGITLRDDVAPTVANVRGSLFAAAAKTGTAVVEFDAADRGGGVYRMVTTVDGKTFEVQPAAFGTCADIDPSNSNPYEFPAKVPCPLTQAGLSLAIDTTKLSEGAHTIAITLEDAAGNSAAVVGPVRFTVRNARPNGSPAGRTVRGRVRMWFAANRQTTLTTRVGRRVVTRGYLRDPRGRGIRGAQIEVYHYVNGRPRLLKTGLRSRRAGRLTLILPLNLFGDSRGRRRIAFYYRALVPGAVTSRANLFLTIRSPRGGPQTTQPG